MGECLVSYEAYQLGLGRRVAIKIPVVNTSDPTASEFRERFLAEARLGSRLTHPNTVRILEFGQDRGICFIAMEFIEGVTLSELVMRQRALDPLRVTRLGMQLCGSLAEAHSLGVVHRDLKPTNLMVASQADGSEHVRVLDFGIAKVLRGSSVTTQAGLMLGTPGFMAPEQIVGQTVTARSDIYGVGALLYLMCTGSPPFMGENIQRLLYRQLNEAPVPFAEACPGRDVPQWLEWVTLRCLERDPAERFATASVLAQALAACQVAIQLDPPDFSLGLDSDGRLIQDGMGDELPERDVWPVSTGAVAPPPSLPSFFTLGGDRKPLPMPMNPLVPVLVGLAIAMGTTALAFALLTAVVLWSPPDWGSVEPAAPQVALSSPSAPPDDETGTSGARAPVLSHAGPIQEIVGRDTAEPELVKPAERAPKTTTRKSGRRKPPPAPEPSPPVDEESPLNEGMNDLVDPFAD